MSCKRTIFSFVIDTHFTILVEVNSHAASLDLNLRNLAFALGKRKPITFSVIGSHFHIIFVINFDL